MKPDIKENCKNINQFCYHFAEYYKHIFQDIIRGKNQDSDSNTNTKMKYKQSSAKEVVEIYYFPLLLLLNDSYIFLQLPLPNFACISF